MSSTIPVIRHFASLTAMFALLAPLGAHAAQSLGDILRAAEERGHLSRGAEHGLARSRAELARAQSAFEWQLGAESSVERRDVFKERNGFLRSDTETETFLTARLGVSRQLRNGMRIAPALSVTEGLDDADEAVVGLGTGIGIGLEIPLWRGADLPPAVAAETVAEANLQAAESELQHARQRALAAAAASYWRALAARRDLEAVASQVAVAERALQVAEALADQGEIGAGELVERRGELERRRLALSTARRQEQLLRLDLARHVGAIGDALPEVDGELPAVTAPATGGGYLDGLVAAALERRADLRALEELRSAAETRLRVADDGVHPDLSLRIDTDAVTLAYVRSLGGAPEQADQQLAQADLAARRQREEDARSEVAMELRQLLIELAGSADGQRILAAAVASARERVAGVAAGAEAGQSTYLPVADAESDALGLERQLLAQVRDHALLLVELHLAVGGLAADDGASANLLAETFQGLPKP